MKTLKRTFILCLLSMVGMGMSAEGIPNNEIWYTSSNGQVVKPSYTFAATMIVSNTYADGKGVIKFDGDVTSIGNYAFYECTGLTSITIPNSVTSIGDYAFRSCTGLTSVTIPNSVTSIGSYAFYGCFGLTNITIPNSVTSIEDDTFRKCTGLTSVTIPNSVTSIGSYAFYDCSGLTSVTIGNSVTSIGSHAFEECSVLDKVYVFWERPISIPNDAFDKNTKGYIVTTLYVPTGRKRIYEVSDVWGDFYEIVEFNPTGVRSTKISDTDIRETDCYDLNGREVSVKQRGIQIVKMSDGSVRKVAKK